MQGWGEVRWGSLGVLRLRADEEGTHGRDQKNREAFGEGVREGKLLHFSSFFFSSFSLLLWNQWHGPPLRVGLGTRFKGKRKLNGQDA